MFRINRSHLSWENQRAFTARPLCRKKKEEEEGGREVYQPLPKEVQTGTCPGHPSIWWSGLRRGQEAKSGRKKQHEEASWWVCRGDSR